MTYPAWDTLEPVERTLLIPLLARVWAHRWHGDQGLPDQTGERILARLAPQVPTWWPDPVTLWCILWRTQQLVAEAQAHFARHPRSCGVNLGAGLSDYFQWLDNGVNHWLDIDRARVMQLRAPCMPARTRASGLALDLDRPDSWTRVAAGLPARRQPLFVMLEGVLLYWRPAQVNQLLVSLGEQAPAGSSLVFDVIPRAWVGWPVRMPSADEPRPTFQWGLESVQPLVTLHPRLQLQSVRTILQAAPGGAWLEHNPRQALSSYAVVRMVVS